MVGRKQSYEPPREAEEDWLITYADAITLLMAFFVMILTFSKVDMAMFEQVQAGIAQDLGHQKNVEQPLTLLSFKLEDAVHEFDMDNSVTVDLSDDGVTLEFASSALYDSGTATVKDDAKPLLDNLVSTLSLPSYKDYFIDVEGHTDNVPIHTARFPSNWDLSAARAINVVRYLIDKGVEAKRFKAAGYADIRPKVPNLDYNGEPLLENQAQNRRIVIDLHL